MALTQKFIEIQQIITKILNVEFSLHIFHFINFSQNLLIKKLLATPLTL